ncbi:armadillo repeat-containing protein 2 [Hyposmocoma kahamanoa]|uniref:armadillo repeat-containing protein 2 n=1 Tax=Hyposmocoma kahamanoa TaxID=1477025 RepID=UPI000E6D9C3F|nr:armadillo repeat-containing protein 2 [Hyposmocoma kahamanoa]
MSDRGGRRGAGAPFYAPPRRKTSAEIISEARAAVYGEMSGPSSGAGGALRSLRTRRPFTPREPQRTLFTERTRKKDTRPPSAFDLKYLSLQENNDEALAAVTGARIAILEEELLNGVLLTESTSNTRKKPVLRKQARSTQERTGDGWAGLPKLPHLNGRSKPLHRRNTSGVSPEESTVGNDLAQAISVTRPLGSNRDSNEINNEKGTKSLSPDAGKRRLQFSGAKSVSCETNAFGDISVKQIAVQLPNASCCDYDNMSILELAEALSHRSRDTDETFYLLEALQNLLESSQPTSSLRELVLRALYMHVDSDDERVLVAIARSMLTIRVTGNHLSAACKLVFKIARNDNNDHFFRNSNLLELLVEGYGRADPLTEGECCVYGAGALRFLALEPRLCMQAHRAGALHLAALHLKILNNAKAENPRAISEHSIHALYQLTGALRNLAGAGHREIRDFVASGALGELVNALLYHTDRDVLTNVARCLSVLSAEETCCAWLCASSVSARALLLALAACAARAPLAVRLAYTLGNMAAADEQARINIYEEEGGVDVLLTILESYTKRNDSYVKEPEIDPDLHLVVSDLGGSDGSNEDVLIKTVRVVANLCLAERAGRGLADVHAERTIKALLSCLRLAEKLAQKPVQEQSKEEPPSWMERHDELATASLATLNNITFYREPPDPPDPLDETLDHLCKVTCKWLSGSGMASCEAVRALGNLTRATKAAQLIVLEGAMEKLVPFFQHDDASVRCAAAGVLVNVCGAGVECKEATEIASQALSSAARTGDSPAAALLARALWNAHAHRPLNAMHANHAATALTMFIDDESVFAACQATRADRRNSEPGISKHLRVKFDIDNNNYSDGSDKEYQPKFAKAYSVDQNLHLYLGDNHSGDEDGDRTGCSDQGFEDGDVVGDEECNCEPCRRLAAWEELVGVAIPLLEKLRPPRADASVGTD